jgi:WD40 repeat protein
VNSESLHTLRGHTSTVRCLKMSDSSTAISGSRDTTLRVWDIKTGLCKNVLVGHQASVRCLEIKGDIVVSGSYDTTARVWSISEGRCLRTLSGHFSQIYAIAFDGNRIATGSLDTSVRIWDPSNGYAFHLSCGTSANKLQLLPGNPTRTYFVGWPITDARQYLGYRRFRWFGTGLVFRENGTNTPPRSTR